MLQYIINLSAIWLFSFAIYEVFLKKENYHGYNRLYLIATFLMGIVFPLVHLPTKQAEFIAPLQQPIAKILAPTITTSVVTNHSFSWYSLLIYAYLGGVVLAALLMLVDIVKLVLLYYKSNSYRSGIWNVVTTGGNHAPFSFLNTLFAGNPDNYTPEEWRIILAHEARHYQLGHLADVLLMQISRIVFWFHPLVYVFQNRLLLVHEFQADSVANENPVEYGHFLIDQSLLAGGPSFAHSFNSSPIKNRITMLSKTKIKASKSAKMKLLMAVPLIVFCLVFCTQIAYSGNKDKKDNKTTTKSAVRKYKYHARLGDIDSIKTTFSKILANPRLVSIEPGGVVKSFTVMFLPKGKDLFGPYYQRDNRDGKLNQNETELIKGFIEAKEMKLRLIIEDIIVEHNNVTDTAAPIVLFVDTE